MKNKTIKGYPMLLGYLGIFMMMIGLIVLLPLFILIFYPNEASQARFFIIPGTVSIILGYMLTLINRGKETEKLERHQDAVLIFSIWIIAILISSIPFMLSGTYNFSQSVFESTSGYSTTGLSVVDVTQASHMFLLFRALMQFFGGVGLVLVLTSAVSDKYGMRLYNAEGHNDKLLPNLLRSARLILSIYTSYIVIGSILYVIFGMPLFDAFCHAIASVSTGGFSTQSASIGYYDSLPIEIITMVLMLLGATNLIIHIYFFKGKIKKSLSHVELKLFAILTLIFLPLMILSVSSMYTGNLGEAIRTGLFQFMSAITTTGFQTVPTFTTLPHFFNISVIILMVIGGGIGSTAGGIKQYRVALSIKHIYWNLRDRLSNKKTLHTDYTSRFGKEIIVTDQELSGHSAHILLYLLTLGMGTLIFTFFGYSIGDALFEFASALGTVGLSIGVLSYSSHPVMLWTASIGMFLGRLEFYVVLIALSKMFLDLTKKRVL
ncbi:MAG: potassium transporter [Tenericutes bacterium GWD2_38_27]|nr:MAG: potassium transporter [Tenericutes bacterium GWD2_38_27]HBG32633.1 potassium transporter [Acholeplasmataceae bacterium]HCB67013.1 potassium transporter [Acholeplasmataceae bacterium]